MEMKRIKMIGLDLDGTLLNNKKQLTPRTRKALLQAVDAGVTVLAATGRPITGVPKELLEFPGMRYVLTSNGARIIDQNGKRILYESLLPYDISVKVLNILEGYQVLREIYFDGQGFVQQDEMAEVERYLENKAMADYIRSTRRPVENLWRKMEMMEGHGLDKVHGIFKNLGQQQEAKQRILRLGNLSVSGAMRNSLEINGENVNKGIGLLKLGELLGICRDEIMACGDGGNDLEMLRTVGFGVAMANGTEEVRAAADYVTASNEEDGVAAVIEKFVLSA